MKYEEYPVLYVDDDDANRVVMKHTLSKHFSLHIASSAKEALEILDSTFVAVLLTDQRMPGETGVDLAEKARLHHPDVIRVIITAYSDLNATVDAINRGRVSRFIKKPWTREEVIAVVHESIKAYHDTRKVKDMEERLIQQDRIAVVGIFASSIAHDLRQPCAAIMPATSILAKDVETLEKVVAGLPPRESTERIFTRMRRTLDHLGAATDRLHLVTQSLLGYLTNKSPSLGTVSVQDTINGVVGMFKSAVTKRARLELELGDEELFVMGSAGRLSQLVSNLLLNASQAVPVGNAAAHCIRLRLTATLDSITMEVSDTGPGVPEHLREKIFEPLFTTKGKDGSGLGLAICTQVVGEMAGTIELVDTAQKGTTFRATLPRLVDGDSSAD